MKANANKRKLLNLLSTQLKIMFLEKKDLIATLSYAIEQIPVKKQ